MTTGGGFSLTGGAMFNPPKTTSGFSFGTSNANKGFSKIEEKNSRHTGSQLQFFQVWKNHSKEPGKM
ncbi:hypothetical protein Avbf_01796 [Armadillidium vulgare]|nr:hypothetical protein Avbf_01796 [Armadillidium vulgare]